jgi:hypothetical protein
MEIVIIIMIIMEAIAHILMEVVTMEEDMETLTIAFIITLIARLHIGEVMVTHQIISKMQIPQP